MRQWRRPERQRRYKHQHDNSTRRRLGCLLGHNLPWPKRCYSRLLQSSRVFSQDAVELHPLSLLLQEVCNKVLSPQQSPWMCRLARRTKEAFQEVSSAFQEMSTKHGQIQGSLQVLASTVEALKQAQQGEVASSVQVQETLRRTASVASDLEAKTGCNICCSRAISCNC